MVSTKIFNMNNKKYFLSNESEYYNNFLRSCDTEDWSNDAENTALITLHVYSNKNRCNNISPFLANRRNVFQNDFKNLTNTNLFNDSV